MQLINKSMFDILSTIANNEGICSSRISRKTTHTTYYVFNITHFLINNGFITREKKNKREYSLYLTEKGKKLYENLSKIEDIVGGRSKGVMIGGGDYG